MGSEAAVKWAGPLRLCGVVLPMLVAAAAVPPALAQSSLCSGIARSPRATAPASEAGSRQYLIDARKELREDRTGPAREALERAETRLLGRDLGSLRQGTHPRLLQATLDARAALAAHDAPRAAGILDTVLAVRVADVTPAAQWGSELAYPPPEGVAERK